MTQTVLLGNVCTQITDGAHWSPSSTSEGYPMASVKDMCDYGFNLKSCRKISLEDYEKLVKSGCRPEKNDILIAKDGSYLKQMFVSDGVDDVVLLSSIAILKPDLDRADPRYLVYYIRNQRDNHDLSQYVSGAAIPRIILKNFARMPISLPDLETQKKIADILGSLDEKIELNRKMNETLEQIGQALFRHYFIDNPEAEKWDVVKLADVVKGKNGIVDGPFGTQMKIAEYQSYGVPIVEMKYLEGLPLYKEFSNYISNEKYEQVSRSTVTPGDIIMSKTGTLGLLGIMTPKWSKAVIVSRLLKVTVDEDRASKEYIFYLFKKLSNEKYWDSISSGSTMPIINLGHLKNLTILLPSMDLSKKFSLFTKDILSQQLNNLEEIQKLTFLRDTLLPRLINRKVTI